MSRTFNDIQGVGPNKGNTMDDRGREERYMTSRSGGLHPEVNGQCLVGIHRYVRRIS